MPSVPPAPAAPPAWLVRVVEGASTLDERLEGECFAPVPGPASVALAEARMARWAERVAGGDAARFARRLAWDDLEPGRVRAALGTVRLRGPEHFPGWAALLGEAMALLREGCGAEGEDGVTDAEAPLPFEALLLPFVAAARRRLEAAAGPGLARFDPAARRGMERALLGRLARVCGMPLYVELSALRAARGAAGAHAAFVARMRAGGLEETFARMPVLARMAAVRAERWAEAAAEVAARLHADAARVGRAFGDGGDPGAVAEVRADLSDPHRGGRTVAVLRFRSGLRVVLKPRGLAMDAAWGGVLAWLAERGVPPLRSPRVLDRGAYGWAEFVEAAPCGGEEEVARFHHRAGMLLALQYALGGGDLHAENLVAAGADPVAVDVEVLLAPYAARPAPGEGGAAGAADRALWESVLRTQLLPSWSAEGDGPARREGGLVALPAMGGGGERWRGVGTDWMAPGEASPPAREPLHLPRAGGEPRPADGYVDALEAGFAQGWRALEEHGEALLAPGGPLATSAAGRARLVLRHTRTYAALLRRLSHPRFLASGVERSLEVDVLCRPLLRLAEKPRAWALMRAERRDLEDGDVPVFTVRADSVAVEDSAGAPLGALSGATGLEEAARRVRGMDEEGLEVQRRLLRLSFASTDGAGWLPPGEVGETLSPAAALEEAVAIGERVARAGYPVAGGLKWVGLDPRAGRFAPGERSFAAGSAGVGVFLAACGAAAGRDDLRQAARLALRPLVRTLATARGRRELVGALGPGGATGAGGLVYALASAGETLGDGKLVDAARLAATAMTPRTAGEDPAAVDAYGGSAGAVLGLLALHARTGDAVALERAVAFGRRLARPLLAAGEDVPAAFRTSGLAHGLAGVALALERLARATGEGVFAGAAARARGRLDRLFAAKAGNWREGEDDHGPPSRCAWCHGAAGIVLSLLDGGGGEGDGARIGAALATVSAWPLEGADHLCCGNLGRAETLLHAALRLGRPALGDRAAALAAAVVRRARRRRTYGTGVPDAYAPGFLQGLSGIGHALLRLHAPETVPCALLWE